MVLTGESGVLLFEASYHEYYNGALHSVRSGGAAGHNDFYLSDSL